MPESVTAKAAEGLLKTLIEEIGGATTKADIAYQVLREAIVSGIMAPGAPLAAGTVAAELGMSRIPVREAFRKLEQEGLVSIRPHFGATVRDFPFEEIEDSLVIRAELESLATRLAVPNITTEILGELDALVRAMDDCIERNDAERYGRLNRRFHFTIYEANPNEQLLRLIEQLWGAMHRSRGLFGLVPAAMRSSQVQHRALVTALRHKDSDAAERIVHMQKYHAIEALRGASSSSVDSVAAVGADLDEDEKKLRLISSRQGPAR